ncbi:MAG: hypothetical protein ACJ74Q_17495 [Pyrinomonadaceae bacterium]
MAESSGNDQVKTKITELRERLMGDLSMEELQRLKLQIDVLEGLSNLSGDEKHDHDKDSDGDHDHEHA